MGRPAKKDEEKRQLIGSRYTPDIHRQIADYAAESGRSMGAEVERRVLATMDMDEATLDLLAEVAREIQAIQKGMKGRRWHKCRDVWAAVVHMFRTGPIILADPEGPQDDEEVQEAWFAMDALRNRRDTLIDDIGLGWSKDPVAKPRNALTGRGLFGQPNALAAYVTNPRSFERANIDNVEDEDLRNYLIEEHDKVVALDEEISEARRRWIDLIKPYNDAEEQGRRWNRERQMENAKRAALNGEPSDHFQRMGVDPWALRN